MKRHLLSNGHHEVIGIRERVVSCVLSVVCVKFPFKIEGVSSLRDGVVDLPHFVRGDKGGLNLKPQATNHKPQKEMV